jgi:hypothetical protein
LIETSQPPDDLEVFDRYEKARDERVQQVRHLPRADRVIWVVLSSLFLGLRASSLAEKRWGVETADKFRKGTIVKAAQQRAEVEGRSVPPVEDMTMEEALALLAEPYSPDVEE